MVYPFYVALPSSTFDWQASDGLKDIPIEERDPDEVRYVQGDHAGSLRKVLISPPDSPAANPAFDVTPARLVTGLITERGICRADETDILRLFPEKQNNTAVDHLNRSTNSKSETIPMTQIRISKQDPKDQVQKSVWSFEHSIFGFISYFDIRILDFSRSNQIKYFRSYPVHLYRRNISVW